MLKLLIRPLTLNRTLDLAWYLITHHPHCYFLPYENLEEVAEGGFRIPICHEIMLRYITTNLNFLWEHRLTYWPRSYILSLLTSEQKKCHWSKKLDTMLAGIKSSLGVETEKKSVFGATGDKLKAAGSKLAAGEIPTFQDESAFSKCCPNLTMKQVCLYDFYVV